MISPISAVSAAAWYIFGVGSKVAQLTGKRPAKARLVVIGNAPVRPVLISCFIEDISSGVNHKEGKGFKIPYLLNRLVIKNDGRIPAEYCEGFISRENIRKKLPWSNLSRSAKIEISSQLTAELDLCAMAYLNPIEFNRVNRTLYDSNQITKLMKKLQIPPVISPNEFGIQSPPSLNRVVGTGECLIEINYNSTENLLVSIMVNSQMDERGIFITLT